MQCFSVTLVPELVFFSTNIFRGPEQFTMSCGPIPDICKFWYATIFWTCKKYATKVRKFATKIASQQNSVNQYLGIQIHILGVLFGVLGF